MHLRRVALLFLGIWLGIGILIAFRARQDETLTRAFLLQGQTLNLPGMKTLGPGARPLLLHAVREQTRWYIRQWTLLQIGLAAAILLPRLFAGKQKLYPVALLFLLMLLAALQQFAIVPEMFALGRLIDFMPPEQGMPERNRQWVLDTAYYAAEAVKWLTGLLLAGWLIYSHRSSGRSRDTRRQFDTVDKPDYGRVNW